MSKKLDAQKLALELSQPANQDLLQNIINQSKMIQAAEQVTIIDEEKPQLNESYVDSSTQWLVMAAVASKHNS